MGQEDKPSRRWRGTQDTAGHHVTDKGPQLCPLDVVTLLEGTWRHPREQCSVCYICTHSLMLHHIQRSLECPANA